MKFWVVLFVLLMLGGVPPRASSRTRLALQVSPAVAIAPADLIVRATIEADPSNRAIEISAESDLFYRSSEIQLEGDAAPRTNRFEFRGLPGGVYMVRATLKDANEEPIVTVAREVDVVASPWER